MKQVCLHSCDISINRFNRPLNDLDSSDAIARFCMFTETFEPIYLALYITVQQIRLFVFDPTFFLTAGIECITEHNKFGIVCLDMDVLNTALVGIHNARCNPLPDPIENRSGSLEFISVTDVSTYRRLHAALFVSHIVPKYKLF